MFTRTFTSPQDIYESGDGHRTAVPASTTLFDSGPLDEGYYVFELRLRFYNDTVAEGKGLVCLLRNNIDDFTVEEVARCAVGDGVQQLDNHFFIDQDERLKILSLETAGSAQSAAYWRVRLHALPE